MGLSGTLGFICIPATCCAEHVNVPGLTRSFSSGKVPAAALRTNAKKQYDTDILHHWRGHGVGPQSELSCETKKASPTSHATEITIRDGREHSNAYQHPPQPRQVQDYLRIFDAGQP
jgi:hypothetical protein